jgi:glycogen debranching enzyme
MGAESGTFEMWIWPWKPLRNFQLSFLLGTSTVPIAAADVVRTVTTTPAATVFTYTYESFTIREIVLVPRDAPGAVLLLDIHTTTPLTVIGGFMPVMQPQWPAGIGGQYSYWDDEAHAYLISEGRRRAAFLCGSPAAEPMAAPPAHMFADAPLEFRIDVKPEENDGGFVPIVITGGTMSTDSLHSLFTSLWRNAGKIFNENVTYYENLHASTLQVTTPRADFNRAFAWGKIALDNLMVRNPRLGYGMVAGYGLSGGGGRPGFSWFFGGDAFINSLALTAAGALPQVRDALAFTQKWQRKEDFPIRSNGKPPTDLGKMAHELSQSDGLCDWWNDYHYGYNHADTTPWYLVAMGAYVRASGDTTFLRESWPSVRQAYTWCVSKDSDGDGLMDLKGAGLGALEFGKLKGIYADVYTCGIWVQGLKEMIAMAAAMGDAEMGTSCTGRYERASLSLEKKFWVERSGLYSYGVTETGEQVTELTPWPGVAMMFGLFAGDRTQRTFSMLNSSELCTDWGVRSLARSSPLFEPTNYNYGAVWPFIGAFFNTAQFRHADPSAAFRILQANIRHSEEYGTGIVPEVFSGELNQKLGEAYHHQGFSTTGYLLPFVSGLLGLETDAPGNSMALAPRIPADWDTVRIGNIPLGSRRFGLTIVQTESTRSVIVSGPATSTFRLRYSPSPPPGSRTISSTINGRNVPDSIFARMEVRPGDVLAIRHTVVPALLPQTDASSPGAVDESVKIISCSAGPEGVTLIAEGRSGTTSDLRFTRPDLIEHADGAHIISSGLRVAFPPDAARRFTKATVLLTYH